MELGFQAVFLVVGGILGGAAGRVAGREGERDRRGYLAIRAEFCHVGYAWCILPRARVQCMPLAPLRLQLFEGTSEE